MSRRRPKVVPVHKLCVGQVVAVRWLDSGKSTRDTLEHALRAKLSRATAYGRVVHVDAERLLLAHDWDEDPDETSDYGLIWVDAVLEAKLLDDGA